MPIDESSRQRESSLSQHIETGRVAAILSRAPRSKSFVLLIELAAELRRDMRKKLLLFHYRLNIKTSLNVARCADRLNEWKKGRALISPDTRLTSRRPQSELVTASDNFRDFHNRYTEHVYQWRSPPVPFRLVRARQGKQNKKRKNLMIVIHLSLWRLITSITVQFRNRLNEQSNEKKKSKNFKAR